MFGKLLLVLMIPTFLLYTTLIPQNAYVLPPPADLHIPIDPYDESNFTFDQLLNFIETAENSKTISQLSLANLDKLAHLMTILAKEGILPGQEDLEDEIDADIDDLQAIDEQFAFMTKHPLGSHQYTIDCTQNYELMRCGWVSKKWKKTRKFVHKHKKTIIIGAAAVIVVTVIVVTAGAASGAAAAAGATAASQVSEKADAKASEPATQPKASSSDLEKISADFKQKLANTNPELIPPSPISEPTIENIRDYSSVITHQMTNDHNDNFSRLEHISNAPSSQPTVNPFKIDESFGTDLTHDLLFPPPDIHPDALPHYIVGQKALEYSNYPQALQAFDKAIEIDPETPSTYLDRSYTYLFLSRHRSSQEDYQRYRDRSPIFSEADCIFTYHFAKGIPKGAIHSGKQLLEFAGGAIFHPIHTSQQVYTALSHLSKLAYTQQWKELGSTLAPEVKLLIEEWNNLPDAIRGERAGYILGKYGADIVLPGVAAKAAYKGVKTTKDLAIACRNLTSAERLLVLEAGVGLEGAKFAESFQAVEKIAIRSEEAGSKIDLFVQPSVKKATSRHIGTIEQIEMAAEINHTLLKNTLSFEQLRSLKKFNRKVVGPAPIEIYDLPNGGKVFQKKIYAKNIPESYAVYEKQVSIEGKTLQFTKTTISPEGTIVHVKQKAPLEVTINESK